MASIDDRWMTTDPTTGERVRSDQWGKGLRFRARYREYPRGPQKGRSFAKRGDAERFLVETQHRLLTGTYTPPQAGRVTLRQYAEEWQGRRSWAPSTTERISRELRLHILPSLGNRPLASIRRAHIEEWAHGLDLQPSSARMVYETLSNILGSAVADERIPKNPAIGASLPSAPASPFLPLETEQVRSIAAAMTEHIRAAVVVAAGTGLRQGELFGLTGDRVAFLKRELRVDRQLYTPGAGSPFFKPPKSANSYRTVSLSPIVVTALSAHIEAHGTGRDGLVFHTGGRPIGRAMASKYIRTAATAAGLAGHTWHDLRHHHASVLLSEGVSPALVAERLGHDLKTLLATYAHVIRRDDDRVRAIVDGALGGSAEDWLRERAS